MRAKRQAESAAGPTAVPAEGREYTDAMDKDTWAHPKATHPSPGEFLPKTGRVSFRKAPAAKKKSAALARIQSVVGSGFLLILVLLAAGSLTVLYQQGTYLDNRTQKKISGASMDPVTGIKKEMKILAKDLRLTKPKPIPPPPMVRLPVLEEAHPPEPPPAKTGGYAIQVAATNEAPKADEVVEKLKTLGFDAYTFKFENKKRVYYRVRVGRNLDMDQAKALRQDLKAKGYQDMFITDMDK